MNPRLKRLKPVIIVLSGSLSLIFTYFYLLFWADYMGQILGDEIATFLVPGVFYFALETVLRQVVCSSYGIGSLPSQSQDWVWRILAISLTYLPVGILMYGLMYGETYVPS